MGDTCSEMQFTTSIAPVNIAVIKYWGKRNEALNIPLNDSISMTLDVDYMSAKTSICASRKFDTDRIWLNGKEEDINNPRIQRCLAEVRRRIRKRKESSEDDNADVGIAPSHVHVHICSENNFPTAAGLASSAAGYACMVHALCNLFNISGNVSDIARLGSGSASRSLNGGFVQWETGRVTDGSDSLAFQIASQKHWPELRVLICVVSSHQKAVSSSEGMKRSFQTSTMLRHRPFVVTNQILPQMLAAIQNKDFPLFAQLTMKDSNQLHACCLDTFPPIFYLNETSTHIIDLIHKYNDFQGECCLGYTFDAGPNACIVTLDKHVDEVLQLLTYFYAPSKMDDGVQNQFIIGKDADLYTATEKQQEWRDAAPVKFGAMKATRKPGAVKYVISTQVGRGPETISSSSKESLLDEAGLPKHLKE